MSTGWLGKIKVKPRPVVQCPGMAERAWNNKAKWMGNLIPLLCMLPFAAAGAFVMLRAHAVTVAGVATCLVSLAGGWAAVNRFGFFDNDRLKREVQRRALAKAGREASQGIFVGFARPSYVGLLDAHEDLGFLFVDADSLHFLGELHEVKVPRKEVLGVRYRPNFHSTLGLGRWVSVEIMHKGKRVRLLVEPREAPTLLANRKRGTLLRKQIQDWLSKT